MEQEIIEAIALRLKLEPSELVTSLKEGETWKADAPELIAALISDHMTSAKDQQHKRGVRETNERLAKFVKSQGFTNPEAKEGAELIEAYKEWALAQAGDDDGGKKPAEMTKEELAKLPVFKAVLAEKLTAAEQQIAAIQSEFDTYKGKEIMNTVKQVADKKLLEVLEKKGAILEAPGAGVTKEQRLASFKKLLPFNQMRLDEKGEIVILGDDGDPLTNDFGKPITFESIVVKEWSEAHGFPKQDPSKGGFKPGINPPKPGEEGYKMTFATPADFDKYIKSEPDAAKRFEAQKAYAEQTAAEEGNE